MTRTTVAAVLMLIICIVPVIWPMPSLAAVLLTAPALLLLPAGFGLFLLYGFSNLNPERLTKIQTLLLAYFFGLFVLILIFVASERFLGKASRPDLLIFAMWCLSLVGLLRLRTLFEIPHNAGRKILVFTAIVGLLVATRYVYSLAIYSEFPIVDLFQRVQFHGGAWEFARNLELNPFVAASYIPYQQLQLGLVLRLTGADPLVAEWIWPIAMAPLQAAAIYALFSQIFPQRRACILASALALTQLGLSNPTNGTLAELASITLISLALSRDYRINRFGGEMAIRSIAIIVGVILGFALNRLPLEIVLILTSGLLVFNRIAAFSLPLGLFVPILSLSAVTIPFHRGALLYLALGTAAAMSYKCLVSTGTFSQKRIMQILRIFVVTIVAFVAAMVGSVLLFDKTPHSDTFGLFWIFDIFLIPLTGKSLALVAGDGDLAPGVGARVALFELGRTVSPLVVCVIASYLILQSVPTFRNRWFFPREGTNRHIMAQVLVVFGLISLILTGFPFIHRAAFLVTILASATATNIFLSIRFDQKKAAIASTLTTAYAVVLVVAAYILAPGHVHPYLDRALSVFVILGIAVCASLVVPARNLAEWRWKIGAILVLSVGVEVALVTTYFKSYAFNNQPPPPTGAYSSFDRRDLRLADFVSARIDRSDIVVSDPKTMTFIRARTGLYPLLSTSNLDTVAPNQRSRLVSLLGGIVSGEKDSTCADLMALLDTGASAIRNYDNARELSGKSGKSVLAALGYDNRLIPTYNPDLERIAAAQLKAVVDREATQKFLIIVGQATMDWLDNPETLHYFPEHRPLAPTTRAKLQQRLPDHQMFENTFIAELTCL